MKDLINYGGHTIQIWVELFDEETNETIECYDNPQEARQEQKCFPSFQEYGMRYAAAEVIDNAGNLNFPTYGNTWKAAVDKQKKLL